MDGGVNPVRRTHPLKKTLLASWSGGFPITQKLAESFRVVDGLRMIRLVGGIQAVA